MMNFPLNLAVGAAQPVYQVGNYVYYKSGSAGGADPSIKVKTDLGDEYILQPGQGFRLDNRVFGNLQITNAGGVNTIIGQVLIADGGFFDNRVTGSVEIIDGGKNRTLAGTAFAVTAVQAGVAAKNSVVQLWNFAGTGKRLIVSSVSINSASAGYVSLWLGTNAAATIGSQGVPKLVPSAVLSVAFARNDAISSNPVGVNFMQLGVQGNQTFEKKFAEPVVIRPGAGLLIYGPAASDLFGSFEYFEETDA
ncbi:hypothetical protein [Herbaspirillum huttiense]|uniref:hypothetical protein n=1 Tax=Herbaspirillum huttiense TaxID=863372 RepID=UPI0031D4CAAF